MFLLLRLVRPLIKLVLALALIIAAFIAWALLWPSPHITPVACHRPVHGCAVASGRVLFHTAFGPHTQAHLVLISSSSLTLPGVVIAELPEMRRTPPGLGLGDWVVINGRRTDGSHGEHEIAVLGIATSKARIRCGGFRTDHRCTSAAAPQARR